MLANLASKITGIFTEAAPPEQPGTAKPDFNTQLSIERTQLAHERTLMAWVRTATSLITFGFTIYKFFQLEAKGKVLTSQLIGPRTFALIMIVIGIFALAVATLQHLESNRKLRRHGMAPNRLVGWVAGLVSLLGILAIVAVIFNV